MMDKYELWIDVPGGEDDDERIIYKGSDRDAMEAALEKYNDEVFYSSDKYFSLITLQDNYCFNNINEYYDFWAYKVY